MVIIDYRVIKENDLFMTTNKQGDIPQNNKDGLGLYYKDMRYLSKMEILINDKPPVLLSSKANENDIMTILLTNKPGDENEPSPLWNESVEVKRKRFIYDNILYESVVFTNFYPKAITFNFTIKFDADFNDMFIIRGFESGKVGKKRSPVYQHGKLVLSYDATDHIKRETHISWDVKETRYEVDGIVHFQIELQPQQAKTITFLISPIHNNAMGKPHPIDEASTLLRTSFQQWKGRVTQVKSDMPTYDALYNRGIQDMRVLLTDLGFGAFPVAGLPWFAVPFGRDSLIASLQLLPINPDIARGTLLTLAAYQGTQVDEWRDEQPGKIMHEIRYGELANTNQIPFTPYYGSVDSTPLFLLLLAEYCHWTGDTSLIQQLMPNIEAALHWINEFGDLDKDGFVEYDRKSAKGISNQGWKDSGDSIIHKDGHYAEAPIALVEVQGYVYQAKTRLALILKSIGNAQWAHKLEDEASQLKHRFEEKFWMKESNYYAIALDHDKKQVCSITSNPGHILMTGIADSDRAACVAKRLVSDDMFSGYGIRTMSKLSAGYNPMSYHDGSVWPHDNSLCLIGLSVGGFHEAAKLVMEGLLKAAEGFEYNRLPELFCGYDTEHGAPIPYPVACSPQAWAAGTPLVFVQIMLGIKLDASTRRIQINPSLPDGMNVLSITNLAVANGHLSLSIQREYDGTFKINMIENTSEYDVTYGLLAVN